MKVKYEFEIDKKEYHKVLCEACWLLERPERGEVYCPLSTELATHRETEKSRFDAMSYLESKCPLEVVK